jgi:hypothetical protein
MKYGVLKQTNPEYRADLWRKLDDLYVGGFQILERAKDYIPLQVGESPDRYAERLSHAEYVNYLGMVVDSYAANLFAQKPVVTSEGGGELEAFWSEFAKNANLKGDDFSRVMREVFTSAILKQRSFIACDFPASDVVPNTRADEDALGSTRGYAFEVCPEELIDWNYADVVRRTVPLKSGAQVEYSFGLLSWAILRREICKRATPESDRDTFVEEFRLWKLTPEGVAVWELYRTEPRSRKDAPPDDDADIRKVDDGITSFRQIPIVEMCIPPGLWLGNKLGPLALALFRRRSALLASENRSLFPIPVFKHGPEIGAVGGALPPDAQQNPSRGRDPIGTAQRLGALGIGHQDDFSFVEPKGTAHTLVDKQLHDSVDEFFRVAHMMASSISSTSQALGRSGASKEQDYRAMSIVLDAYGAIVRDAAYRVYDVIAEARGEDIDWKVLGLDKFDVVDRAIVLEEAKSLSLVSIPSNTFRAHWQTKVALALLGDVTPDQQKQIQDEIERGVAAEEQMRQVLLEDMQDPNGASDQRGEERGATDRRSGGRSAVPPRAQDGEGSTPQ